MVSRFFTLLIAKHVLIHELCRRQVPVQWKTLNPTQSPEELNVSFEIQISESIFPHEYIHMYRREIILSQFFEFYSHSCRTEKVLQMKQPLQPLSQQQILSLNHPLILKIYTPQHAPVDTRG